MCVPYVAPEPPAPDPTPEPVEQSSNPLYSEQRYYHSSTIPASAIHPGRPEDLQAKRVLAARDRAEKVYPGPVGALIFRELDFQLTVNLRHDREGATMRLVEAVMAAPLPEPPAAALSVVAA